MTMRLFALTVLISATVLFQPVAARADSAAAAGTYIDSIASEALGIISGETSKDAKQKKLEKLFSANVNIPWVARFVLGRYWRQASDVQKTRYLAQYERFMIRHYTSRFADYSSGTFKITGIQDDGDYEYTVSMSLQGSGSKNSEPVFVDYRVRKDDKGGFKIFDVIVEGISMITTQRSEFASVLSQHDIDYLTNQLESKAATGDISLAK